MGGPAATGTYRDLSPEEAMIQTRRATFIPAWIENAMILRWPFLIAVFVVTSWSESILVWTSGIVLFLLIPVVCYRIYRRTHPMRAEVIFYSAKDGYCMEFGKGDGDGDGGE